jgi:hypothetical protein
VIRPQLGTVRGGSLQPRDGADGSVATETRRGCESDCANPTAWVIHCAPSYRAGGAAQLLRVTRATQAVRNTGLAAAVLGAGRGPQRRSGVGPDGQATARLRAEAVETVWAGFLQIATDHGPAQIRELRDKLIATYGHDGQFQRRQDQLKHQVSLSEPLDDDGIAEYRLRLDPEGKEVLEAILGPLSAPRPTPTCPDLRPGDQRRGQALVEICRRAAAAGGAAPVTTKAAVFITVSLQDLQARCAAGSTLTGQLLATETIRRIACDAMIIPTVLGTASEVLDLGRARRLFTPRMLRAMWLRDKGCTPAAPRRQPGPTHTTSSTGPTAEPPACSTAPCSAGDTTPSPTKKAGPQQPPPTKSPGTPDHPARRDRRALRHTRNTLHETLALSMVLGLSAPRLVGGPWPPALSVVLGSSVVLGQALPEQVATY